MRIVTIDRAAALVALFAALPGAGFGATRFYQEAAQAKDRARGGAQRPEQLAVVLDDSARSAPGVHTARSHRKSKNCAGETPVLAAPESFWGTTVL